MARELEGYEQEKLICNKEGLQINNGGWVLEDFGDGADGSGMSKGGANPCGWQIVCHISKLEIFLARRLKKRIKNFLD